jgi:hypothetical protein
LLGLQTEGLSDFFEAVRGGFAGNYCVGGFALSLLLRRLGKVIIAQVKLAFQVVPDAGQAAGDFNAQGS